MTVVLDASVVVAGLIDTSDVGRWAEDLLARAGLVAPELMPFEAANILRRVSLSGEVSDDVARLAHADLLELSVDWSATKWALREPGSCGRPLPCTTRPTLPSPKPWMRPWRRST